MRLTGWLRAAPLPSPRWWVALALGCCCVMEAGGAGRALAQRPPRRSTEQPDTPPPSADETAPAPEPTPADATPAAPDESGRPPSRSRRSAEPAPAESPAPAQAPAEADESGLLPPPPPSSEPRAAREELSPLGYTLRRNKESTRDQTKDFLPIPDRWRIGLPGGYPQNVEGRIYDPYNQNVLKGDYPIIGDDIFLVLTATSDTTFEARRLPVPSGVSTLRSNDFDFFGVGDQQVINQNFILSAELFQGDAAYKPRDFELRATLVGNLNYVHAEELNVVNPYAAEGRDRFDQEVAVQELFFEKHLGDLSPNYDFWAVRVGMQGFTSDFRGFLFSDNEPGVRLFGSYDNNKIQWNLAYFAAVEKDTNSGLNTLDRRDQDIFIANLYRQDFLFLGYTAQLSFHANIDRSNLEYDRNGFLVRPAPVGAIDSKEVHAYYLGWAGDGHIGRLNISHQFYYALGQESFNPLAGRGVDINAQFFAIEASYDQDWRRYRASFVWASGDSDPEDGTGGGVDSIFDNPNFAGGGFNFFTRQAIRLTGSGVNLVNRNSFVPDLRTSKEQGQANFVNPGLFLYNVGLDMELTPRLTAITNVSYLRFADTQSLEQILQDDKIPKDIGIDISLGLRYRPNLTNNIIINVGAAALVPGDGFKGLYGSETLYSTFLSTTFTF